MKTFLSILICFLLFGCTHSGNHEQSKKSIEINEVSNDNLKSEEKTNPNVEEFNIERFQSEADSLLKFLKGEKYLFELRSDTFDFKTDNPDIFTKGHGIFRLLYRDSSERIVRHYFFEPNTEKLFRIYIVEADYRKKKQLEQVVVKLETSMNEDFIGVDDTDDFTKMRLSPTNDYVMTSDKTLFWLNLSYPYSNQEVLKFIDCLKGNVDSTLFKGRIICLFGSDCRNKNVP